jgi:hypothetical protein
MSKAKLGRVTVRQEPHESGLAQVTQSPRGFIISVNGKRVGCVRYARRVLGSGAPWFWYAHVGNSAGGHKSFATREEARDACVAWVKAAMKEEARAKEGGT